VKAVGSILSCEKKPHLQTHSIAFDRIGASIAIQFSLQMHFNETSDELFSNFLLSRGFNIAGLEQRFQNIDFRERNIDCDQYYLMESYEANPSICNR
jgi:hypothetical protein